jgi:hypothetical protein
LPTKTDPKKLQELQSAKKVLKDVITALFELEASSYILDSVATELFSDYEHNKQKDALSTSISAQASLYGKSAGKVLRIAGILHVLDIVLENKHSSQYISVDTLKNAIRIVDYLDGWTLTCHATVAGLTTQSLDQFERRVHLIALRSKMSMGWTDVRNQMSSKEKIGKTVVDAEAAMQKFVALGLGEVEKGPNGGLRYRALKSLPS